MRPAEGGELVLGGQAVIEEEGFPETRTQESGGGEDPAMAAALGLAVLTDVALFIWLPLVLTRLAAKAVPALPVEGGSRC